ncbi:MAG TPA: hypothetical protein VIX63_07945 [Vicinamibacterales bacterium]
MNTIRTHTARSILAAAAAVGAMSQGVAFAQAPHSPDLTTVGNRWTITAHNDESPVHEQWATQGICFRFIGNFGTHARYEWWSDTFPDWNGVATQEGNEITMHGDYANDVGHDGIVWNVVTATPRNMGAGFWFEWREDAKFGRTIGFANALLQRVGRCTITADQARNIPFPLDKLGREMLQPFGNVPTAGVPSP